MKIFAEIYSEAKKIVNPENKSLKFFRLIKISGENKRVIGAAIIIFFIVVINVFLPLHQAKAVSCWLNPLGCIEEKVLNGIQTVILFTPYVILWIFSALAAVFIWIAVFLLNSALNPAIYIALIQSAAVDKSWTLIRDASNLFFILILIFISLATILRLSSYSARTWLPKLLIAAVLINFSKVITMFIIDIGNVFMYGALNWIGSPTDPLGVTHSTGIYTLAYKTSGLMLNLNPITQIWDTGGITITSIVIIGAFFLFNIVLALTLLALGIFLIIRITMLIVLTILSPAAFMLFGWPSSNAYHKKWWSSLIRYTIFGPIFVFFLYISSELANVLFTMGPLTPTSNISGGMGSIVDLNGLDYLWTIIIPYMVLIIMLLASLSFTKDLGIMGAGMIMGTVTGLSGAIGGAVAASAMKPIISMGQKAIRGTSKTTKGIGSTLYSGSREIGSTLNRWSGGNLGRYKNKMGGYWNATKDTAKQIPGAGTIGQVTIDSAKMQWNQTVGTIKDSAKMQWNQYQEDQKKEVRDKIKRMNMSEADRQSRMKAPGVTNAEFAAYSESLIDDGKSLVDRKGEKDLKKEIDEITNRPSTERQNEIEARKKEIATLYDQNKFDTAATRTEELKNLEQSPLRALNAAETGKLNEQKEKYDTERQNNVKEESRLIKIASTGGLDKGEIKKRRPDLVPALEGIDPASPEAEKKKKEQINKMQDEGVSINRINKEALNDETILTTIRDDIYKNDPDGFRRYVLSRGSDTQDNIKNTLYRMLEKEKGKSASKWINPATGIGEGKLSFDTGTAEGEKNFHNAAMLTVLDEKGLNKVFQENQDAIQDFIKLYWKDLTKFTHRDDKVAIAQNIGLDTIGQFGKRDLNPGERRDFVKILLEVNGKPGKDGKTVNKEDILNSISTKDLWAKTLKDAKEIDQLSKFEKSEEGRKAKEKAKKEATEEVESGETEG